MAAPSSDWIFGFGSLIHNPGFDYSETLQPCYIRGYRRVFHQGSTDHRGVPEAPGRTVTLEPAKGAVTWGAAFKLAGDAQQRQTTLEYLEWREKQYDQRALVDVHTADGAVALQALTFIATADTSRNPNYLGPAPLEDIAHQIATARGPSGPNWEYLFRLADAMRQFSVQDEELFELEVKVWERLQRLHGDSPADPALAAALVQQRQRQKLQGGSGTNGTGLAAEQQSEGTAISVSSGSVP
ncbi:Cation transport regulator 2 isoform B [Chlorella sorokiniana]|uniref:glutathione-specific gamma-glutamylcyclotransferase n=1 Tax=Chlorella sorokiniana TaxID=3076 RepID=A0A2P6TVV5_CHLSO|nr:Cation transport regulator 2 isoform A [Chlorella sorokiniana]PRW58192.1 Cation transport regulator 2 isoform B [Chlorella sorokiniana]|eukprot:PRW58191.1 Cation transport regulator 2 isoform A [Chlorella sorokiniana]